MGLAPATGPIQDVRNFLKSQNTYPTDQCTWQAKNDAPWIPNYLGDASGWFAKLKSQGYPVSTVPVPGSVMIYKPGAGGSLLDGHVAYVTKVNKDWTVDVDERNWIKSGEQGQRYTVDWRNAVQGFALNKGDNATASQYELAYAQGTQPPLGPSYSATQAGSAIGGWAGGLVSKPFLGVLQIVIGGLLLLGAAAIFALIAIKGATPAAAGVAGTIGRARGIPAKARPPVRRAAVARPAAAPAPTSTAPAEPGPRVIDVRTPAGRAEANRVFAEGRR